MTMAGNKRSLGGIGTRSTRAPSARGVGGGGRRCLSLKGLRGVGWWGATVFPFWLIEQVAVLETGQAVQGQSDTAGHSPSSSTCVQEEDRGKGIEEK